jgi:hypothetical protein
MISDMIPVSEIICAKMICPFSPSAFSSSVSAAKLGFTKASSVISSSDISLTAQLAPKICDGRPCMSELHLSCMYRAHAIRFRRPRSHRGIDQADESKCRPNSWPMATSWVVRLHESASGRCNSKRPACTVDSFGLCMAAARVLDAMASRALISGR